MSTASDAGSGSKLPSAVYLAIAIVAVVFVLQNFTRMGRYIVAIGGKSAGRHCLRRSDAILSGGDLCALLGFRFDQWSLR